MHASIRTSLIALAASLLWLGIAGAASAGDTDIGCGPGTQIWEGNSGVAPKVLGATTNGSFGLQTFGITFGTLGCNQGGTVTAEARIRHFAGANLDRLAREMARGDGETLRTLGHLMGVPPDQQSAFAALGKQNFAVIWAGDDVTERQMLQTLRTLMADDDTLSAYVDS